jgi:hypothetical protein
LRRKEKYTAGDLVRIASLPRGNSSSPVWKPDPSGPYIGLVIEEKDMQKMSVIVGQCLLIELETGELVTLSSNLLEHALHDTTHLHAN